MALKIAAVIAIVLGVIILVTLGVLWWYTRRAQHQPPVEPYQPNRAGLRADRTRRWELTGDPDLTQPLYDIGKDPDKR